MAALPLTPAAAAAPVPAATPAPSGIEGVTQQRQLSTAGAAVLGPRLRVYGRPGTFGALAVASTTPSGDALVTAGVRGWGFLPGQAAYFPVVAPDGTVLIANEPQTDNQLQPTARQMVVSTFDPARGRFANVRIPTNTGQTTLAGPWASADGRVGGGDISDLGLVRRGTTTQVAFTSAMPYWGWPAARGGEYPTLGVLRPGRDGAWFADPRRSTTASQLAASAVRAAGARRAAAARAATTRRRAAARRAARAIADACVLRDWPATGRFGDCRMPAEFEQLPASRTLVVTHYAFGDPARRSGRISAITADGRLVASFPYPTITLPDGTPLAVHPREVVVDPTGRSGDERFVVVFDAERGLGRAGDPSVPGAMQEFRFDAASGTITALSAPVLSGDQWGQQPLGFETARYASDGSLWVGQTVVGTLAAGPLAVYRRPSPERAVLGSRPGCGASASWRGQAWGRACAPDDRVGEAAPLGVARSLDEDAATGRMLLTTMSGFVLPIARPTRDGAPVAGRPINLGLDQLADRTVQRIGPRKAALDPKRQSLWIPIQQLATDRTCAAWPCSPAPLDQWLIEVDLRQLDADPTARADATGRRAAAASATSG